MTAPSRLVRVQEKGQVTLPADVRKQLGLKKGDLVSVTTTGAAILITPQATVASQALDQIGAALTAQGLTLDDMIERGRVIREELYRETYGQDDKQSS